MERGSHMPNKKRIHAVVALEKPDRRDEGLAVAERLLAPWQSEITLVHVDDRPAAVVAAAENRAKRVVGAKTPNGMHDGQLLQRNAPARAGGPGAVEEGLLGASAQIEDSTRQRMAADFAPVVRMLKSQGYPTHVSIRLGNPVEEIIAEAEQRDADLIVLATRGRSVLSRLVSRSVSEGVLHASDVPVLLAHAESCGRPAD